MVNPPKDETVRIRKLLEQFGSVGDANVFYWFQNRRSRSRRRQRQLQASLMADPRAAGAAQHAGAAATSSSSNSPGGGFFACASSPSAAASSSSSDFVIDDSADDLFSISRQMGFVEATQTPPFTCSSGVSHLHIQPETITVFIDGVASEVPKGPIDLRAAFGHNVMLVHSSGQLLPVNEHGILMQSLQMGESYFSVSTPDPFISLSLSLSQHCKKIGLSGYLDRLQSLLSSLIENTRRTVPRFEACFAVVVSADRIVLVILCQTSVVREGVTLHLL
ncbi:WUSCHEL-related homeobox [Musa troglodytarum]|uniref:WUSCHEL-related homeobox n=1 Tax=Musa troglodytarum TaxID=320322 RepID=A0A9E7FV56_9LILI|nr:WUSCHEL-related homeobox [Musa troglodytarum]